MPESRIYTITETKTGARRLVEATHPSHAHMHVARSVYSVHVATQKDLAELLPKGTPIETIKAEQQALPE